MKLLSGKGFTLVEILVAISVFIIVTMIVSAVFVNTSNLQRHLSSIQRLQNEGRFILEKISKEARVRELDYQQLTVLNPNNPQAITDSLVFKRDENDAILKIKKSGDNLIFFIEDPQGAVTAGVINASDVTIEDVKFFVSPSTDPFTLGSAANEQPRVTILLKIKNRNVAERYLKHLTIETTISSKVYKQK